MTAAVLKGIGRSLRCRGETREIRAWWRLGGEMNVLQQRKEKAKHFVGGRPTRLRKGWREMAKVKHTEAKSLVEGLETGNGSVACVWALKC